MQLEIRFTNALKATHYPRLSDRSTMYGKITELLSRGDMTNREIARELHMEVSSVTPRIHELRGMGVVELSEIRECGVTANNVCAWRLVNG